MPEHQLPPVEYGNRLKLVAMQVGSRLGTIRILEQRQLQASTDGLTGLLNRRAFTERFREVATRGQAFCLAIADLDHFKKLNDTFGHEAGDRALRRFADLLGTVLPEGAVPARMGGEEFLILFPDLDLREAFGALEVLRMALHEPGSPSFTASFGLVDQSMGRTLDDLVRVADQALYDSKEGGRDRVTIADVGAGFRQRDAEPQYGVGLKAAG
jgi:diguanylate cyclase (GGDEF)-like protein